MPAKWEGLSIDDRRKVVAATLAVTILPTEKRGPVFDPDSARVTAKLNLLTLVGDVEILAHDHVTD